MRHITALALFAICAPIAAQNYYIPDSNAAAGTSNVIPFGSTAGSSFYNCRMQVRATAAELGNLPNLITGLGFAPSGTGAAHYDTLDIVMDHIPASQAFSTTFANNLTANAITVLSVTDYTWHLQGNTWNEVGLQNLFVFNGVDDLVIDITTTGGTAPSGMRRGTNQRIYDTNSSGPTGATGVSSNSATKFEVSMFMGRTSMHGVGCAGSNGTPMHTLTGTGQVGATTTFDIAGGLPSGTSLLWAGYQSTTPYPIDLASIGMPTCYAYTDLLWAAAVPLDASGSASVPFAIPANAQGFAFYSQYACLDLSANALGFTTSNYGRVYTGN